LQPPRAWTLTRDGSQADEARRRCEELEKQAAWVSLADRQRVAELTEEVGKLRKALKDSTVPPPPVVEPAQSTIRGRTMVQIFSGVLGGTIYYAWGKTPGPLDYEGCGPSPLQLWVEDGGKLRAVVAAADGTVSQMTEAVYERELQTTSANIDAAPCGVGLLLMAAEVLSFLCGLRQMAIASCGALRFPAPSRLHIRSRTVFRANEGAGSGPEDGARTGVRRVGAERRENSRRRFADLGGSHRGIS
jgi:hypothetical protein